MVNHKTLKSWGPPIFIRAVVIIVLTEPVLVFATRSSSARPVRLVRAAVRIMIPAVGTESSSGKVDR